MTNKDFEKDHGHLTSLALIDFDFQTCIFLRCPGLDKNLLRPFKEVILLGPVTGLLTFSAFTFFIPVFFFVLINSSLTSLLQQTHKSVRKKQAAFLKDLNVMLELTFNRTNRNAYGTRDFYLVLVIFKKNY